jgi:hypothetical protein
MDLNSQISPPSTTTDYDGPDEIRQFADFLESIGEVVIAFSRLERQLTWAIESCLKISIQQADAIQDSIMSVTIRIDLFDTLASAQISADSDAAHELEVLLKRAKKLNIYRNMILHGPWYGTSIAFDADGTPSDLRAMKSKNAKLGASDSTPKPRVHTAQEMRESAYDMLNLGAELHRWVMKVFPDAQNRVP